MEYVWVKPAKEDEFELPFGARVVEKLKKHLKLRDDNGQVINVSFSKILRPMHPSCVKHVDDMIMLEDLQEFTILRNLELRYKEKLIYTYTGNVLIAINPYQLLPIYGKDVIEKYKNKKLGELPPHLFAIGDASYTNMKENFEKQCIIINGESGAGKTQSAKLLLQYYATITGNQSCIEEQILDSNPILEAFGNARTLRNENSSRFGKYISIYFNRNGKIEQADIKQFLLEKSRVVMQCEGEQNYHVFYMLFRGLAKEEKDLLGLKEISFYKYLNQNKVDRKPYPEEIVEFETFRKALKTLKFSDSIVWKIFELLAAILHFGNINYHEVTVSGVDAVEIMDSKELSLISIFMGVTTKYLKTCLSRRTMIVGSERVIREQNRQEAMDTRDAFMKAIYNNLFNYIVKSINETIHRPRADKYGYIGVLDVFGFENFQTNSFEQLCINLANETLQQFFIRHIFKIEQRQYIEEGILWFNIDFVDNADIIDMICVKPMNIFSVINDQSVFPHSNSESLLGKLIEHHQNNKNFLIPKFSSIEAFGIIHFAGAVLYDVKDFLEKNRDSYSYDYINLARNSDNDFLRRIFAEDLAAHQNHILRMKKKPQITCSTKFKHSLDDLMGELNQCQPFFVRCIQPNKLKKPGLFERTHCCQQIRYSGIRETSKIRQVGFAVRYTFREFVQRYGMLISGQSSVGFGKKEEIRDVVKNICSFVFNSNLENQCGCTRIFLRNSEYLKLEKIRENILTKYAVILQKSIRRWLYQKRYTKLKNAAVVIQKIWRGRVQRKRVEMTRLGFLRLQALINARYERMRYLRWRHILLRFQACCKGFAVRRMFYQKLEKKKLDKSKAFVKMPEKAAKPFSATWNDYLKRGNIVKQDSYLHRHLRRMEEEIVDESFNFLYDHARPKNINNNSDEYYWKL